MNFYENRFVKLFSQSAILSIGTVIVSLSLFLFKIIFYQKSLPIEYSTFLVANLTYLFYQIIGFMNIGNPLSNDVNQYKEDKRNLENFSHISNAFGVVLSLSLLSNIFLLINLFFIDINWLIILMFCGIMFLENSNLVIIGVFRGMENVGIAATLHSIKGLFRPLALFGLSFGLLLTTEIITLTVVIAEASAFLISIIIFTLFFFKQKEDFKKIRFNKKIFGLYIYQGLLLVIISLCIQGFRSSTYIFLKYFVSEEIIGFFDVPLTFLLFALTFFVNIGLMLAVNNRDFTDKKHFLKILLRLFFVCLALVVVYEVVAYFITWDDQLLEIIFKLDGADLAKGVMIILPSFPFYVLFYVIIGYQQGFRKYIGIALTAISSLIISIAPNILFIMYLGLNGALWGNLVFSFFLALFSFLIIYFEKIDTTLELFKDKIKERFSREEKEEIPANS